MLRFGFRVLLLAAFAGCQVVSPDRVNDSTVVLARGQRPSETDESPLPADSISLAADCLARGDDTGAANHLTRHVAAHPDQLVFRAQLGEILARLDRLPDAQAQFEAAVAHAQEGSAAAHGRLVHFHTRLMEIARQRGDEFREHLHRGIGLYLIAVHLADRGETGDTERLLFKAAGALKEAQERRSDDARTAWYLYRVWSQLDQPRPAERALRKAASNSIGSDLTPTESRDLALASPAGHRP
jgi:tetratricopeptide (TPR) repeat protein